jgi:hypothetical protein
MTLAQHWPLLANKNQHIMLRRTWTNLWPLADPVPPATHTPLTKIPCKSPPPTCGAAGATISHQATAPLRPCPLRVAADGTGRHLLTLAVVNGARRGA